MAGRRADPDQSQRAETPRPLPHELRAEHAFWVFGFPFMVLHYRMHRKITERRCSC
jgi:hypothetical protein